MSDKLNRLLDIECQKGGGIDVSSVKKEYDTLKAEITNDLEKVNACGNLVSQVNELLVDNEQLKEKLKVYTEPFKLRPTYQILENKLSSISSILAMINNVSPSVCSDEMNELIDKLNKVYVGEI